MKTKTLLDMCQLAKPALGANDAIAPVLSHFVFAEDMVYAYNDIVAIIVQTGDGEPIGLECALHGDTLLGLLGACGEEVKIRQSKDGVVELKTASGWVKVPALDVQASQFQLPDEPALVSLPLNVELLRGLQLCLVSVADDSLNPAYSGVTINVEGSVVALYSTDNHTATRYLPKGKFISRKSVAAVLPKHACQVLLKLCEGDTKDAKLDIGATTAVAQVGSAVMVARTLQAKPEDYAKMFGQHIPKNQPALPDGLGLEISKACTITAREIVREMLLTFSKGSVAIASRGVLGKMETALKSAGSDKATVNIDPQHLQRVLALEAADKWGANSATSLVLLGDQYAHIISSRADAPSAGGGVPDQPDDDIPF